MLTPEERIAALEDAVTRIEGILNVARFMSPRIDTQTWGDGYKDVPELPSGDRNVYDNLREIRTDWAAIREEIDALRASPTVPAQPAPVVQTPPITNPAPVSSPVVAPTNWPIGAYKRPIRPLTNGEQRNAIDALVRAGKQSFAEPIELNFTKGIYPVCDFSIVEPIMEVRWAASTPQADKDALDILLSAIDQRIPNGDGTFSPTLLPLGDPRIVPISGTLNASPASAPIAQPAGSAQVVYTESVAMVNPETGFTIWLGMSKNDDGLSVLYNYQYPWNAGASSNPKLPQMLVRMERDGGVSINGTAPQMKDGPNGVLVPVERTQYDGLRGKDFIVYPNGYNQAGKGEFVDVACMQPGRKLRLGASTGIANPTFPLVISPDGVTVDGRSI